ncbi:MAG: EamA family transporter [Nitrospirota bacterium]|nr:EamA family transporter [Nitrospirota bacterium]
MSQYYILSAIFLWSSLGVVFRLADVPVHIFLFYSLLIAVVLQSPIVWKKGYLRELSDRKKIIVPFVLGLIALANSLTFFYAFRTTTISNAVLTHYTAPVIVAVLAALFLKEKITGMLVVAIVLSSLGLWIMLDGFSIRKGDMIGIFSGLASGISYAVLIIIARMHAKEYHPFLLTYIVNITILLCLAPFVREFPLYAVWAFFVMGIVHSIIAPVLYYRGLQDVSASRAAVLGYLEPVCAILLSMIFLSEMPGPNSLLGGMLILISGYMTVRSGS